MNFEENAPPGDEDGLVTSTNDEMLQEEGEEPEIQIIAEIFHERRPEPEISIDDIVHERRLQPYLEIINEIIEDARAGKELSSHPPVRIVTTTPFTTSPPMDVFPAGASVEEMQLAQIQRFYERLSSNEVEDSTSRQNTAPSTTGFDNCPTYSRQAWNPHIPIVTPTQFTTSPPMDVFPAGSSVEEIQLAQIQRLYERLSITEEGQNTAAYAPALSASNASPTTLTTVFTFYPTTVPNNYPGRVGDLPVASGNISNIEPAPVNKFPDASQASTSRQNPGRSRATPNLNDGNMSPTMFSPPVDPEMPRKKFVKVKKNPPGRTVYVPVASGKTKNEETAPIDELREGSRYAGQASTSRQNTGRSRAPPNLNVSHTTPSMSSPSVDLLPETSRKTVANVKNNPAGRVVDVPVAGRKIKKVKFAPINESRDESPYAGQASTSRQNPVASISARKPCLSPDIIILSPQKKPRTTFYVPSSLKSLEMPNDESENDNALELGPEFKRFRSGEKQHSDSSEDSE